MFMLKRVCLTQNEQWDDRRQMTITDLHEPEFIEHPVTRAQQRY